MREITKGDVDAIYFALKKAHEFFLARDEMNGKVHCAETRLSPITELVGKAKDYLGLLINNGYFPKD